jgi:hypothetical protein
MSKVAFDPLRVKFSANKWKVWLDGIADEICFRHPDAPDETTRVAMKTAFDIKPDEWLRQNATVPEIMDRVLWKLINQGTLYHPFEELN